MKKKEEYVQTVYVCAKCNKNTSDNFMEMHIFCHEHFKEFLKKAEEKGFLLGLNEKLESGTIDDLKKKVGL